MRICTLFIFIVFCLTFSAFSQDVKNIQKEKVVVTGFETGNPDTQNDHIKIESVKFNPVITQNLTYTFQPTYLFTGYDLQSNGTPQQIWQDPGDPDNVYMVFTTSSQTSGWTDRKGTFTFSDNLGQNWQNAGQIGINSNTRSGFATITGLNDGRPVAALHTNDGIATTRSQVYVRDAAGSNWSRYDPGSVPAGEPIWPRVLGIGENQVSLLSSINGAPDDDFFINSLNISNSTFSGWNSIFGDQAETYNFAKSRDESVLGLVFMGNMNSIGNLYYTESIDNGLTWSDVLLIYTYGQAGDSLGAMRGVDIIFLNNDPYIVFEVIKQDILLNTYFPSEPSKIMLWSPALNNGVAKIIADENNIPYFEQFNSSNDIMAPLCRPSIGKSADDQALFITINATTSDYLEVGLDANTYFAGYFMYSLDQGQTFSFPERFTPSLPLRDWRFISLNPVNYIDQLGRAHVMMAAQSDTIPGSTVNAQPGYPKLVSAELIFVSTEVQLSGMPPAIIVTLPNGGENWAAGTNKSIHWLSTSVSSVNLEYTTDQGSNWMTIANSIPNTGSYSWTVPGTLSTLCKVRISDASDSLVIDQSNSNFSIVQSSINLEIPNGGENWAAGTTQNITWSSAYVSQVKIEYSTNSGTSWLSINNSVPNTGSYTWTIPNTPSNTCKVRISSVENINIYDESNNNFSIVQKSISLVSPNGGEQWAAGSVHDITWLSSYITNVRIQYSTNSGNTWNNVVSNTPNTGSYSWTLPNISSNYCKVKITDPSSVTITDVSDTVFSITQASVSLTAPNGGEIWLAGSTQNITWTSSNVINVKIELSINNGVTWTEVVSSSPSIGIYNWTVPNIQSLQCLIRISDVLQASVLDISDEVFAIQPTSSASDWLPDIPTEFALYQNFPNPFNPVTTIYYGIPEGSYVKLNVFNLLGEKIAALVNEYKEPGNYKVNFNLEKQNSGLYLYKIEAVPAEKNRGNFIQTKKMIFMK